MQASEADDLAGVRQWFKRLADHVQAKDFAGARMLFAPDMIAFGTFSDFLIGREAVEKGQWRNVWPHIDGFRWRLEEVRAIVSDDRRFAVGMACFDSTGFDRDGNPYERPGRATVSFGRLAVGDPWVAAHTHMSLFRGVPQESFGRKA